MNGLYGTIRPADIDIAKDVELFYRYRPNRSTTDDDYSIFQPLDSTCLEKVTGTTTDGTTIPLLGMFNLKLPLDIFNLKGYYTIYIRPREFKVTVYDTGVLAIDSNVKGVVLQSSNISSYVSDTTGYRLEYIDDTTGERDGIVRLITSCNYCEPVATTVSESYTKSNTYRLLSSNASGLLFCTVTPSSAPTYMPNYSPFIGQSGTQAYLVNTKFSPVMLEVEMVEHDDETISYMLEGDQVRDRDNSIITTYTDDHEIYQQYDYYTTKDSLGQPLRDIKIKRTDIDGGQLYDNVITPGEKE